MRKFTALLLFLALTFASCKKDAVTPEQRNEEPPTEFTFYSNITDNTTGELVTDCDAWHILYLDHIMDFGMYDGRTGTVEFAPDGTCINHWQGDDSFVSWEYYFNDVPDSTISDELWCNILDIRIKDKDTGIISEHRYIFWEYDNESVTAILLVNNVDVEFGKFIKFFPN